MSELSYLEKMLDGVEVEWIPLGDIFDVFAGGDVPKDSLSDIRTDEYPIPILSNGIGGKSLYGWTNQAKITLPSLTISARGTIGWTSYRDEPFFPIVRLLVLTPKVELNLKYSYYFMKMIENDYKVPATGIPQLTKPMIKDIKIPIPCPNNPEKSLAIQSEIVRILDKFTTLTAELTAELTARKKQYNYYRDRLLSFEGKEVEWRALGEVLNMRAGQHISASKIMSSPNDECSYPCFGGNGVRGFVKDKSHNGEHLLIGRQGALCGNVQRMKGMFYATEHAVVVTAGNEIDVDWAFHMLSAMNLNQYASQSAQPGLAVGKIQTLKIPLPCIETQKKTAKILDKFDSLANSITEGLPCEIELRQKQYEYYRDLLFSFPKPDSVTN